MERNGKLRLFARSVSIVLLSFIVVLSASGESQINPYREYSFLFGPTDEVKILATTGVSLASSRKAIKLLLVAAPFMGAFSAGIKPAATEKC